MLKPLLEHPRFPMKCQQSVSPRLGIMPSLYVTLPFSSIKRPISAPTTHGINKIGANFQTSPVVVARFFERASLHWEKPEKHLTLPAKNVPRPDRKNIDKYQPESSMDYASEEDDVEESDLSDMSSNRANRS